MVLGNNCCIERGDLGVGARYVEQVVHKPGEGGTRPGGGLHVEKLRLKGSTP